MGQDKEKWKLKGKINSKSRVNNGDTGSLGVRKKILKNCVRGNCDFGRGWRMGGWVGGDVVFGPKYIETLGATLG
jgi:hypothetical protein